MCDNCIGLSSFLSQANKISTIFFLSIEQLRNVDYKDQIECHKNLGILLKLFFIKLHLSFIHMIVIGTPCIKVLRYKYQYSFLYIFNKFLFIFSSSRSRSRSRNKKKKGKGRKSRSSSSSSSSSRSRYECQRWIGQSRTLKLSCSGYWMGKLSKRFTSTKIYYPHQQIVGAILNREPEFKCVYYHL